MSSIRFSQDTHAVENKRSTSNRLYCTSPYPDMCNSTHTFPLSCRHNVFEKQTIERAQTEITKIMKKPQFSLCMEILRMCNALRSLACNHRSVQAAPHKPGKFVRCMQRNWLSLAFFSDISVFRTTLDVTLARRTHVDFRKICF